MIVLISLAGCEYESEATLSRQYSQECKDYIAAIDDATKNNLIQNNGIFDTVTNNFHLTICEKCGSDYDKELLY